MTFDWWKEIGEDFLVKSNINHWISCLPSGGSLVTLTAGAISCNVVKNIVTGVCENNAPYELVISPSLAPYVLPSLRKASGVYYHFDTLTHANWPCSDPCASTSTNHLSNVQQKTGAVYIR